MIGVIRKNKSDIVYCSSTRAVLSVGIAAFVLGKPVVWYLQTLQKSYGVFDEAAMFLSSRIGVISGKTNKIFSAAQKNKYGSKIRPVPLGLKLEQYTYHDRKSGLTDPEGFVVITVGKISEEKGHAELFDACELASKKIGKSLTLLVLGEPDRSDPGYFKRLQEKAKKGTTNVKFVGWVDGVEALSAYYRKADIFVLASVSEGLPRSVMESMAFGTPVIATDVGGTSDLVVDGVTGLLINVESSAMLADALVKMYMNPSLRDVLRIRARKHVENNHNYQNYSACLSELVLGYVDDRKKL